MARNLKKAVVERFNALMVGGLYAFNADFTDTCGRIVDGGPDVGCAVAQTRAGRLEVSWGGDTTLHVHCRFIDTPNQFIWRNYRNVPHPHGDRLAILKAEGLVPSDLGNNGKWNHYYGDNAEYGARAFLSQLADYAGPADPRIAQWQADDFQLEFPGAEPGDWLLWPDQKTNLISGYSAARMTPGGLSFASMFFPMLADLLLATSDGARWCRVNGWGDDKTLVPFTPEKMAELAA